MSHLIKNFRSFEPGMLVRVTGTPGVYKGTTKFRLMVTSMVPQGEGALQIAFEKLKNQLESEGLFAPERKRPIPGWAANIGLITAKNSSAYFDLIKILSARMPGLELKHLPVNVQGREAIPYYPQSLSLH
jgi:exodeoxyribonuclease VII large subunit